MNLTLCAAATFFTSYLFLLCFSYIVCIFFVAHSFFSGLLFFFNVSAAIQSYPLSLLVAPPIFYVVGADHTLISYAFFFFPAAGSRTL